MNCEIDTFKHTRFVAKITNQNSTIPFLRARYIVVYGI